MTEKNKKRRLIKIFPESSKVPAPVRRRRAFAGLQSARPGRLLVLAFIFGILLVYVLFMDNPIADSIKYFFR